MSGFAAFPATAGLGTADTATRKVSAWWEICPDCKGRGWHGRGGEPSACLTCLGNGMVCDQCGAAPETSDGKGQRLGGGCWCRF